MPLAILDTSPSATIVISTPPSKSSPTYHVCSPIMSGGGSINGMSNGKSNGTSHDTGTDTATSNGTTTTIINIGSNSSSSSSSSSISNGTDNLYSYFEEVKVLFEAPLTPSGLLSMSAKLQEEFREKLQNGTMCMLPSYNHTLPTGNEQGTYLALDVGGSTFRVALVDLEGKQGQRSIMTIVHMYSFRIDDKVRSLTGHAFFEWMADRIGEVLETTEVRESYASSVLAMGLAWSFPIEQTSIRSGLLLEMGKGFCATHGVLGQDLGELLTKACVKKGLNVRMDAVINDGAATLLSRAYCDGSTRVAIILGTGTNAAIILPVTALAPSKFGNRPQSWHDQAKDVLVNTEFSMFGKNILPTTRWDDHINKTHMQPDFQPFEHLISGRYIGEIVRLILIEAIEKFGLFRGRVPERFAEPYSLETSVLAAIEEDNTSNLVKATSILQQFHPLPQHQPASPADMRFVRSIAQLVSRRAAALLATALHALWCLRASSQGLAPAESDRLAIGCNGSVIERYPTFLALCQHHLDELTRLSGAAEDAVVLEVAVESVIYGAAVAVSCLEGL